MQALLALLLLSCSAQPVKYNHHERLPVLPPMSQLLEEMRIFQGTGILKPVPVRGFHSVGISHGPVHSISAIPQSKSSKSFAVSSPTLVESPTPILVEDDYAETPAPVVRAQATQGSPTTSTDSQQSKLKFIQYTSPEHQEGKTEAKRRERQKRTQFHNGVKWVQSQYEGHTKNAIYMKTPPLKSMRESGLSRKYT